MQRYILRRVFQAAITVVIVSMVVFIIARLSGSPVDLLLPPEATRADREAMSQSLGLDKPIFVQYGLFAGKAIRGDFGQSIKWHRPAFGLFMERFPNTLEIALVAILAKLFIALPLGVYSGLRPESLLDKFGKSFAILGQSIPSFWTGIMLILLLSVTWGLLPTSGRGPGLGVPEGWKYLIMPGFVLAWAGMAAIVRLTRSAMLDVLDSEYVKMLRIKGVPERTVVWKHALKNASLPLVTVAALQFAGLLQGSLLVEVIFAWPGIGRLAYEGVLARDFPVVQTAVLIGAVLLVVANLIADVLYAYLDPRIRYT